MARGGRMSGGIKRTGVYGAGSTLDPRLAPGGGRMTREAMQEKNRVAREGLEASVAAKKAEAPGLKPARSKQQMIAALKAKGVAAPAATAPASRSLDIGAKVNARIAEVSAAKPSVPTHDAHMGTAPAAKPLATASADVPPNKGGPPRPSPAMHAAYSRLSQFARQSADGRTDAKGQQFTWLADHYEAMADKYKPAAQKTVMQRYGKAIGWGAAAGVTAAMLYAANKARAEGLGAGEQIKAAGTEGAKVGGSAALGMAGATAAVAGLAKLGMGLTPAGIAVTGGFMAKGVWDHRAEGFSGMARGAYDMSPVGAALNGMRALGGAARQRFEQARANFQGQPSHGPIQPSGLKGTQHPNNLKAIIANRQQRAVRAQPGSAGTDNLGA